MWETTGSGVAGKVPDVDNDGIPPEIDTSRPHAARTYDYFLNGKDNISQELR